jgi:hypothetical protein
VFLLETEITQIYLPVVTEVTLVLLLVGLESLDKVAAIKHQVIRVGNVAGAALVAVLGLEALALGLVV